jgi:hypothetical protein
LFQILFCVRFDVINTESPRHIVFEGDNKVAIGVVGNGFTTTEVADELVEQPKVFVTVIE